MQQSGDSWLISETVERLGPAVEKFLTPPTMPLSDRDVELLERGTGLSLASGLAATAWGDGPVVLLAHGWGCRRTHWGAFIDPLVGAGLRVVAVDAPAHGESVGKHANVASFADALERTGIEIGPLAATMGYSFGAGASVLALSRGLAASRAISISGPRSLQCVIERWARAQGMAEPDVPLFIRLIEQHAGGPIERFDVARVASTLHQPALIIHDRFDKEVPFEEGEAVASAWKGAEFLVTEGLGHRRIMFAPEVVEQVVRFLRG